MQDKLRSEFYEYLSSQGKPQHSTQPITSEQVYGILEDQFDEQYDEGTVFAQQLFRGSLKKVAELIMNAVFRQNLPLIKIDHIVIFTSILQHILYEKKFHLPETLRQRMQTYAFYLIVQQNLDNIRNVFEDGHNSPLTAKFYRTIYLDAFANRCKTVSQHYGLLVEKNELPQYLMQCIVEQKEGCLERYTSKATADWVVLSLVYFVLSLKADLYKQKPVLARILAKYRTLDGGRFAVREVNGDELCLFYNEVVLRLMSKLQSKEVERLAIEIRSDVDVSNPYLVSPIQDQNNTVLDNIVFSSSWEP